MKRIGVLGSGKGSNFRAILDSIRRGELSVEVAMVVSDVEDAGILKIASDASLPHQFIHPGRYRTKLEPEIELEYVRVLKESGVDLIVLAGFMRILKSPFLEAFAPHVMNIHPSLLPAFPGLESWKQALEYGVRYTGCTVHFVTPEMDAGPIIQQAIVPVLPEDSISTLHERIQVEEHRIYIESIRLWSEGRLHLDGRRVAIH